MNGLRRFLGNAGRLGLKELASLRYEPVLLFLVIYSFSFNVYSSAEDASLDVENAALAVVDEDRSPLSRRIIEGLREPYFQEPDAIAFGDIDRAMEEGRYTFVVVIPPRFHADVLAGEQRGPGSGEEDHGDQLHGPPLPSSPSSSSASEPLERHRATIASCHPFSNNTDEAVTSAAPSAP